MMAALIKRTYLYEGDGGPGWREWGMWKLAELGWQAADAQQELDRLDFWRRPLLALEGGAGAVAAQSQLARPAPALHRADARSEERRVGKECRSRWSSDL